MLHRPLFPGTRPEETACHPKSRVVDLDRESIWISYCPPVLKDRQPDRLGQFTSHHRLATPVSPWERLKIGAGTPPMLTKHGWMIVYHGVSDGQVLFVKIAVHIRQLRGKVNRDAAHVDL